MEKIIKKYLTRFIFHIKYRCAATSQVVTALLRFAQKRDRSIMAGCTPASGRRRIILRPVGAARFEGEFDSELSTEDPPGYRSTQRGYPHFKEDSKRIPRFKEDTRGHSKRISQFSTRIYPDTQQGYPRTQHSSYI